MFQANVYKIMIGAPSDIKEEVSIAMNTIHHWNNINAEKQKQYYCLCIGLLVHIQLLECILKKRLTNKWFLKVIR